MLIAENIRSNLVDQAARAEEVANFISSANQVTLLGRGYSLASANYGALILEEAAKFPAIGLSAAQFRHGPLEIVNENFHAIVLGGSKEIWQMNLRLVNDITSLGGKVVVISSEKQMSSMGSYNLWTIPSVKDELLPMIEILPLQQLVIAFANSKGFEAGVFSKSGKVTYVE
jgi:glucosamine--fructose-6-phosphate aminotransferase (isomerizing)